ETLLAWQRRLIAEKYDGSGKRRRGRPGKSEELWGSAWRKKTAVGAIAERRERFLTLDIRAAGAPPPREHRGMGWSLHPSESGRQPGRSSWQHWDLIVAADFFTIEAWTRSGLQRLVVLFFIELSTRKVEIGGIASSPNGLWMNQGRPQPHGCGGRL